MQAKTYSKIFGLLSSISISFGLGGCISPNEDHYALNEQSDFTPEEIILINASDIDKCLLKYNDLKDKNDICADAICKPIYKICYESPDPEPEIDECLSAYDALLATNEKHKICDNDKCRDEFKICFADEIVFDACLTDYYNLDDKSEICDQKECYDLFSICFPSPEEEDTFGECSDGIDNDLNGLADCEEEACLEFSYCQENTSETCSDGIDNDLDGDEDCDDSDCELIFPCADIAEPIKENTNEMCQDGRDNDDDDDIDCDDEDCKDVRVCIDGAYLVDLEPDESTDLIVLDDDGQVSDLMGMGWFSAAGTGNDASMGQQTVEVSTSVGSCCGIYIAMGGNASNRDLIDLSHLYLKKVSFDVQTNTDVYIKVHWEPPEGLSDEGGIYSSTTVLLSDIQDAKDSTVNLKDGQWHHIEYDFFRLVKTRYIASKLTLPFALFAYNPGSYSIRNLRFAGVPEAPCFKVRDSDEIDGETVFCSFD